MFVRVPKTDTGLTVAIPVCKTQPLMRRGKKKKKCDCTPRTTSWTFHWWTLVTTMAKRLETAVLFHKLFEGRAKEVWALGRSLEIAAFRSSAGINQDCSIAIVVKNWADSPIHYGWLLWGVFLYSLAGDAEATASTRCFLVKKTLLLLVA